MGRHVLCFSIITHTTHGSVLPQGFSSDFVAIFLIPKGIIAIQDLIYLSFVRDCGLLVTSNISADFGNISIDKS